ncbi:hypothetical protein EV421DRAFT_1903805 [Armillaria borealis]|uniref:Uncharacterized protein n=1 Tax=Armillaria borealis TaxID=47425 RepID=A0AA39JHN2_9AGAR|nr:hypothetical protein EV421DRAFT_1903805 [Armillaria borealis]
MTTIAMDSLSSLSRPDREPANELHVIPEGNSIRSGSVTTTVPENILDSTPVHAVEEWWRSTSTLSRNLPTYLYLTHNQMGPSTSQLYFKTLSNFLHLLAVRHSPLMMASGSTHSIDIEVEPLTNRFLSPNHMPTILPLEPPDTEPPPGFMPYPSVFVSRPDKSPETPKTIPSAGWGMDEWGNPPTCAAGSPWGGSTSALPAAPTSADPSPTQASISGFDASRTPTPRTAYECMSTLPGFTYPLPPGWTPSNPAHNYPLPTSSGKRSSTSSSAMSSSSMSSSRCGSQSHRSRRSAP